MKTIGFIDYFLDEWHANQYPAWIEKATNGQMKVACAYGKIDAPTGQDNASWCRDRGIERLDSIQSVVDQADYLIVLSPDHPEQHLELAEIPLKSGKPTYVDKTFAPDRRTAEALFEMASKHGTPLFSSSALRFTPEYANVDKIGIESVFSVGPGVWDNYAIHQIEPIVALMGTEVERVMWMGSEKSPILMIGFSNGRTASVHHVDESPFSLFVHYGTNGSRLVQAESDFFAAFTSSMVRFFETGAAPVSPRETIAIISIIEKGFEARRTPFQWIPIG